jgi:hypothetical protein
MSSSLPFTVTCNVKRIPIEVGEIQYLSMPSSTVSSPFKGVYLLSFLNWVSNTTSVGEPTSRFRKQGDRQSMRRSPIASTSTSQPLKVESSSAIDDPLSRPPPQDPSETLSEISEHDSPIHPPTKKKKKI